MSTTAPQDSQASAPAGFGKLAAAIWFNPAEVGDAMVPRVPWTAVLVAAAVIVAVLVGSFWICREQVVSDALEMMRANPQMPADALEKAEGFLRSPLGQVLLTAQNVVTPLVGFGLIALALYLGQLVMGGHSGFGQVFGVTVFACLISFAAAWVVRVFLVLRSGSFFAVSTGLGALVDGPIHDPRRSALDIVDPFNIWAVISAGVALAAPAKLSRNTTLAISFGVYLLLAGVGAFLRTRGGS